MAGPEARAALEAAVAAAGAAMDTVIDAQTALITATARLAGTAGAFLDGAYVPDPEPVVVLEVVSTTSRSVTVRWTTTGPLPASWAIERDGVDLGGTGRWGTVRPAADDRFTFSSLRSSTAYTITLTPDGGQPVQVTAATAGGGTSGPPTELHGPRAIRDGWAAMEIGRDDFAGPAIDPKIWSLYNSKGHGGKGLRRPEQWSIVDDPAAIDGRALRCVGTPEGTTGGMAMKLSLRFGRFAIRMRADGDEDYHHVGLTWPSAENWPVGGEIDFAEGKAGADRMEFFLHYGKDNRQTHGSIADDRRNYSWYEVEWCPDYVRCWCDGVQFFEDTDRSHFNYAAFGAHHLCLQLDWFPGNATRTGGAQMWVDAVRVYAHPASQRFRAPQGLVTQQLYTSPVVDRFAKL
jgi:hypothetical protein